MRGNMRAERVRHGMSLEEAAKIAGMHPNTLGRWERGEVDPLAINLVKLADAYGCTAEYLLEITDDRNGRSTPAGT